MLVRRALCNPFGLFGVLVVQFPHRRTVAKMPGMMAGCLGDLQQPCGVCGHRSVARLDSDPPVGVNTRSIRPRALPHAGCLHCEAGKGKPDEWRALVDEKSAREFMPAMGG